MKFLRARNSEMPDTVANRRRLEGTTWNKIVGALKARGLAAERQPFDSTGHVYGQDTSPFRNIELFIQPVQVGAVRADEGGGAVAAVGAAGNAVDNPAAAAGGAAGPPGPRAMPPPAVAGAVPDPLPRVDKYTPTLGAYGEKTKYMVYILGHRTYKGAVKIGKTTSIVQRINSAQTFSDQPLQLLALAYLPNEKAMPAAETKLHNALAHRRAHPDGGDEWFLLTEEEVAMAIPLLLRDDNVREIRAQLSGEDGDHEEGRGAAAGGAAGGAGGHPSRAGVRRMDGAGRS